MSSEQNSFITIANFMFPHQAAVPRAMLEAEGIPCFLLDEKTVQTYSFYSNAIGGIRLQVHRNDLQQALSLMEAGGFVTEVSSSDLPPTAPATDPANSKPCPYCGSHFTRAASLPAPQGGVYLPVTSFPGDGRNYQCLGCGSIFREAETAG